MFCKIERVIVYLLTLFLFSAIYNSILGQTKKQQRIAAKSSSTKNITLLNSNNFLTNPGFESGDLSGWDCYSATGAVSVVSNTSAEGTYSAKVTIEAAGETWDANLSQRIPVEAGKKYDIKLWANASFERYIYINLTKFEGDWEWYGVWQEIPVTTEWKQFHYIVVPTHTDSVADFTIQMGDTVSTVWIDEIIVQEYEKEDSTNLMINPGFETGDFSGWNVYINNGSASVVSTASAEGNYSAEINIEACGETWDVNLSQQIPVEAGKKYIVKLWAKSSIEHLIYLNLTKYEGDWEWYGVWEEVPVTTGWKQFQYIVTPTHTDSAADFSIQMGDSVSTVWIDEVVVTKQISSNIKDPLSNHNIKLTYEYILLTNYPNPFNTETTIKYSLPQKYIVSLNVYNTKGQLIRTLVNEALEAGIYQVIWSGNNDQENRIASGLYIYQLKTDDFSKIGKMTVAK